MKAFRTGLLYSFGFLCGLRFSNCGLCQTSIRQTEGMGNDRTPETAKREKSLEDEQHRGNGDKPEAMSPNNSNLLRDELKGTTTEHATPPRLEDEGQSGG